MTKDIDLLRGTGCPEIDVSSPMGGPPKNTQPTRSELTEYKNPPRPAQLRLNRRVLFPNLEAGGQVMANPLSAFY